LRKSAKFTAAQNKEGQKDFVDSVGELVAYCEKEGGQIPKYEIKADLDTVDTIIRDMKEYNRTLIYEDKSLAQEIEKYLKNKTIAENMKRDREEAKAKGLSEIELEDDDFLKFKEAITQDVIEDKKIYEGEDEEE
jgi:hypothetical protein